MWKYLILYSSLNRGSVRFAFAAISAQHQPHLTLVCLSAPPSPLCVSIPLSVCPTVCLPVRAAVITPFAVRNVCFRFSLGHLLTHFSHKHLHNFPHNVFHRRKIFTDARGLEHLQIAQHKVGFVTDGERERETKRERAQPTACLNGKQSNKSDRAGHYTPLWLNS